MGGINQRINDIVVKLFNDNNSDFARKMDCHESKIRNYRKNSCPKADFLIKIRENLGINSEWLLTGKGEMLLNVDKINQLEVVNSIQIIQLKDKINELQEEIISLQKENMNLIKQQATISQINHINTNGEKKE